MPVCEFVHMSAVARESHRCQHLKQETGVRCLLWDWDLGAKLGFSGRAASVFNPQAISIAPTVL